MRYQTTDSITGNAVVSLGTAPFVSEGSGEDAVKIYFESRQSRIMTLDNDYVERGGHSVQVFNTTTGEWQEI